jgi:hypothetical protein
MQFKWRKWNRAIHRDLGYVFFAMTVIYAVSGIAINHIRDWNPNYIITAEEVQLSLKPDSDYIDKESVLQLLYQLKENEKYKKHYFPDENHLKIFLDGGNLTIDLESGSGLLEKITRRPFLHAVNFLHYNPGKWWTWFSDIYAGALFILAVSGLFILKGKNGIARRGAILTVIGIIIPIIYLVIFYQ